MDRLSPQRRNPFTSLSHGSHVGAVPPSALVPEHFAAERAEDLQKLLASVELPDPARHLRRRARSWRPFGLARLRVKQAETRKVKRRTLPASDANIAVATRMAAEKQIGGPQALRVRKHWRRPALFLRAHAWAPPSVTGSLQSRFLETHVWHAKRSHMENIWGHRLASHNNALGRRALARAVGRYCCVHDRSYMQIVELFGSEHLLMDVLGRCGIDSRLVLAKEARAGLRRVRALIKACDSDRLIGPAFILWSPTTITQIQPLDKEPEEEEVLPFVLDVLGENAESEKAEQAKAPADDAKAAEDVDMEGGSRPPELPETTPTETAWKLWLWIHPAAIAETMASLNWAAEQIRQAELLRVTPRSQPCFLELIGPKAIEVIGRAIPPEACRESAAAVLWQQVVVASHGQRLTPPAGAVLTLEVQEAALLPCSTGKAETAPAAQQLKNPWLSKWPTAAASCSRIWEEGPEVSEDGYVSVVLVFRPGGKLTDVAAGVDVFSSPGVHRKLWLRCHFAGARGLGFRDRHQLLADAGLPEFPGDFPETQAGQQEAATQATASLQRFQRRPPKKRPNFGLLGIASPHAPEWSSLTTLVDPLGRPHLCRASQLQLLTHMQRFYSNQGLLPVRVFSLGRGVPKGGCHLYRPSASDSKLVKPTGQVPKQGSQRYVVSVCPPPAAETPTLEEPEHRSQKLSRLRRRQEEPAKVETIRPLVGFVTSGGFSSHHGRGVGVGAVVAQGLGEVARDQTGFEWLWLWARTTTSLRYFPVWVQCLPDDQGYG